MAGVENNGGQGRNRTADASLFRAALYHLSYLATSREANPKKSHALRQHTVRSEQCAKVRRFGCLRDFDYNNAAAGSTNCSSAKISALWMWGRRTRAINQSSRCNALVMLNCFAMSRLRIG